MGFGGAGAPPTWSVMGGRWDALVGGSDAPGSADDGGVFSGRSLALCSELVHGRPPAAGCSRAGGSSEGAAFLGTSFVSDLSDFSKTDAFSDTSLLSAADGLPGAGGFSGTGGSEAAGFPETPFSPPPGSLAATLSSSLAQGPRCSRLSLRRGGASTSLLGMRGCCWTCTGPGLSPPPPASSCPRAGVCASSTARRLCLRSCRVLATAWTPSLPSPGAGGGDSGPSASSTLGSLSRKTGQGVGDRIRGYRGAETQCGCLQGGVRKQSPAPSLKEGSLPSALHIGLPSVI